MMFTFTLNSNLGIKGFHLTHTLPASAKASPALIADSVSVRLWIKEWLILESTFMSLMHVRIATFAKTRLDARD